MLTKEQIGDRKMISATMHMKNTFWSCDLVFVRKTDEEVVHLIAKVDEPTLCSISFAYLGIIEGDAMYTYNLDDDDFLGAGDIVMYAMINGGELIGRFDDKISQAIKYIDSIYDNTPNSFRGILVDAINSDNPYVASDAKYVINQIIEELEYKGE